MNTAEVRYSETVTKYDILDYICHSFKKNNWQTSFNYLSHQPKTLYEKPLELPKGTGQEFIKYVDYCYLLSNNFTDKDEAARYTSTNGISIYFSVLLYWLLSFDGVISEKKLKYCQGYFRYQVTDSSRTNPRFRAGMHAWLTYDDAVIDITIWQQKISFDFAGCGFNIPVIMGKIPEGMRLIGFEEDRRLVKDYARRFAKDAGKTFYQWIGFHKEQADLLSKVRSMEPKEPKEPKKHKESKKRKESKVPKKIKATLKKHTDL